MQELDRYDRAILERLQRDASLSVGALAELVGISKSACWRRLQRLEEAGVIRDRVALLDPATLGLSLIAFITVRTNQHNAAWADHVRAGVADIPGILEVYRLGGDIDYLLKAVVRDMPDYDRLYQDLIRADLSDVSASFVMEPLKQTTELPI